MSRQDQTFIDLTDEPDSPVIPHRSVRQPEHRADRARRGPGEIPTIIDLTDDTPVPPRSPASNPRLHHMFQRPPNQESSAARQNNFRHGREISMAMGLPFNIGFGGGQIDPGFQEHYSVMQNPRASANRRFVGNQGAFNYGAEHRNRRSPHSIDLERHILGQLNPLLDNIPELNYGLNGAHPQGFSKPQHVAPAAAREGFTRDTGDDVTAVCASCDEELFYDPNCIATTDDPPSKRPRTRKDREEHHFWAVTACGHVYCRRCFENRLLAGKGDKGAAVGFKPSNKAILCAVDGCQSDVKPKKAWVGIFI